MMQKQKELQAEWDLNCIHLQKISGILKNSFPETLDTETKKLLKREVLNFKKEYAKNMKEMIKLYNKIISFIEKKIK